MNSIWASITDGWQRLSNSIDEWSFPHHIDKRSICFLRSYVSLPAIQGTILLCEPDGAKSAVPLRSCQSDDIVIANF